MPSTASAGLTTTIKYFPASGDADPATPPTSQEWDTATEILQARSFTFPPSTPETIDVTNFQSPRNGRRETIGGLLSSVSVSAELIYKKEEADKFQGATDPIAGIQKWIEVTLADRITNDVADGSTYVFLGTFGYPGITVVVDGALIQPFDVTVDSSPTFTPFT